MNTSIKALLVFTLVPLALVASPLVQALASEGSDDEMAYEDIVKDLSNEQHKADVTTSRAQARAIGPQTSLDDVMIHGGVGVTQMFGTVAYGNDRTLISQPGMQASLGIDLFSENWLAEGTARNFTSQEYDVTSVSLKEFDLKVVYHNRFAPKLGLRVGAGLAARYLHIQNPQMENDYTTPASVFTGGIELLAARNLTVGAELGARSALISDTIDKNSFDMTLRVDANF